VVNARNDVERGTAFETPAEERAAALVVQGDAFFFSRREKIIGLAARYKPSAIYPVSRARCGRGRSLPLQSVKRLAETAAGSARRLQVYFRGNPYDDRDPGPPACC
jgi:hypothetical protein